MIELGQHPRNYSDTVTLLEQVGFHLEDEIQDKYKLYRDLGHSKKDITPLVEENLDLGKILSRSCEQWDGGYVAACLS